MTVFYNLFLFAFNKKMNYKLKKILYFFLI